MGILDTIQQSLQSKDMRFPLGLLAAAGPSAVPQNAAQRLMGLLGQMDAQSQAEEERKARMQMQGLQVQQLQGLLSQQQEQAAAQKRAQAQEAEFRGLIQSPQMAASSAALAGGGGPTPQNAAQIQPVDPMQQMQFEAMRLGQIKPLDYINAQRKDTTPMKIGAGEALVDPRTFKPLFSNPKEDTTPSAVKEYQFAKSQGYPGTFEQWDTARKRAGASSVSVNTGQKGLDNTLKLRGDFRSEPVYKAHQEMQSAYAQIQQSLKQASPAGDLAGATKLMKLLDPGSVVRESELGMAMAASGLLDRLQHYATNISAGTKLTPTQRADFQRLSDALYAESVKQYNSKRSEYQGIAERNGLSVPDVLGAESTAPSAAGKWSITKVQ